MAKSKNSKTKVEKADKAVTVSVKNQTNQKQVLELDGEQLVLLAYETKDLDIDQATAEVKFLNYSKKNIVKLIIK